MRRIARNRPSPSMAVALAALVLAAGGVAFATIPDSDGTIHGCYGKSSGNLRVVESANDCRNNETALNWNQQGPPGPSSVRTLGDVTLSDAETRVLFSEGGLTFTAECDIDLQTGGLPVDSARIHVSTTEPHSTYGAGFGGTEDFSPGDRRLAHLAVDTAGDPRFESRDFSAATPSGTRLSGVLNAGVNVLGRTDKCVFGGHVVVG
jgi:hypothetical protein